MGLCGQSGRIADGSSIGEGGAVVAEGCGRRCGRTHGGCARRRHHPLPALTAGAGEDDRVSGCGTRRVRGVDEGCTAGGVMESGRSAGAAIAGGLSREHRKARGESTVRSRSLLFAPAACCARCPRSARWPAGCGGLGYVDGVAVVTAFQAGDQRHARRAPQPQLAPLRPAACYRRRARYDVPGYRWSGGDAVATTAGRWSALTRRLSRAWRRAGPSEGWSLRGSRGRQLQEYGRDGRSTRNRSGADGGAARRARDRVRLGEDLRPYREVRFRADKTPRPDRHRRSLEEAVVKLSATGLRRHGMYRMERDQLPLRAAVADDARVRRSSRSSSEPTRTASKSPGTRNQEHAARLPADHERADRCATRVDRGKSGQWSWRAPRREEARVAFCGDRTLTNGSPPMSGEHRGSRDSQPLEPCGRAGSGRCA